MRITGHKEKLCYLNFDEKNDFLHIRAAGSVDPDSGYTAGSIPSGYYGINCTISGQAFMSCDGEDFRLTTNDLLFIPKDVNVSFSGDPLHPIKKFWLIFGGSFAESVSGLFIPDGRPKVMNSPDGAAALEFIVKRLSESAMSERELSHAILDIFSFAFRGGEEKLPLAEEIRRVLERHIERDILVSDISGFFCMSERNLERIFSERFGVSIKRYLRDLRFAAACRDLRLTDDPVGRIASRYLLGESGYFASEFRKNYGILPGEYRKRYSGVQMTLPQKETNRDEIIRTIYDYIPSGRSYS